MNLDAKIKSLVERGASRSEIMRELSASVSAAEQTARRSSRAKGGRVGARHIEERALVERIGRILFFLHHGISAMEATQEDNRLYDLLTPVYRRDAPPR